MPATETIFKREDGSRVKVRVLINMSRSKIEYLVNVLTCLPGKRKFIDTTDTNKHEYRVLDLDQRLAKRLENALEVCSQAEIDEACEAAWKKIKPTKNNCVMSHI